jgi:CubicO group peptidase (beta-lactamase class C family)
MGKLQLDDPINNYLPFKVVNPHFPVDPITIRHLVTHTSAIVDTEVYDRESYVMSAKQHSAPDRHQTISENFKAPEQQMSTTDFLAQVLNQNGEWYSLEGFLKKRPGAFFAYTNVGATLAAAALEYTTGITYHEFTTKHILRPLGIT